MSDRLRVSDMMSGIQWGEANADNVVAAIQHMIQGVTDDAWLSECGVIVYVSGTQPDALVCKRCLKATEKYG